MFNRIKLGLLGLVTGLAMCVGACGNLSQVQFQANVASAKANWTVVKTAVALDTAVKPPSKSVADQIAKTETAVDDDLKALANAPAPTSFSTVLANVQLLVSQLPPNVLSPEHQAQVDALVLTLQLAAGVATQAGAPPL